MAFYKEMRMQQENVDTGRYQVTVLNRADNRPVENARVRTPTQGRRTVFWKRWLRILREERR